MRRPFETRTGKAITERHEDNVRSLFGARLSALARRHGVPGAQLAIHHNGETIAVEIGDAEHRTGPRVRRDTAFPIGSISKAFTATVAMILVADGDIELDAPIGEHLPELNGPLNGLGDVITLSQLLSHTSGLASGPEAENASATSLRRYIKEHCHSGNAVLPPGTGFSYSNMGYIVVGRLIEAITGMDWPEAVESILLRPLGIIPAFVGLPGRATVLRPLASGHSVNLTAGRTRAVRQELTPAEAPTGALAASALDLVALGRLHLGLGDAGPLPAEYAAMMRRDIAATVPFGLADGWGCGLALFDDGDTGWAGHDGNADGTSCYLRIDPVGGWIVAFTSNANTGAGMWRDLLGELARATDLPIGQRVPWQPTARPVPPPRGSAGTYANGDVEFVVAVRDAAAHLSVDGQPFAALTVYEDLSFSVRDPASGTQVLAGCFTDDPVSRQVTGIQLGGRVARRRTHSVRDSRLTRVA